MSRRMLCIVGSLIVSVVGQVVLTHPDAPLEFAELLDFNMHYLMSVATPRQDDFDTDRTVPLNKFALNDDETCHAVYQLKDRLEFLFTCATNAATPQNTKLVVMDYSEEEIPPSEQFVVHLTALRVLRDSGVVPRLLDTRLDDERLLVFDYYGGRNLGRFQQRRLTVEQVAIVGARMIEIIATIHGYGIVHGEVWNLKNWVFESRLESLRLTNFKKAGLFVDPVTMEHVLEDDPVEEEWVAPPTHLEGNDEGEFSVKIAKKSSRFRTSSKRRSIFAGGITTKSVSRRDDLASIAETLINWLVGNIDLFADEYVARNASKESVRVGKKNRAKNLQKIYQGKIPSIFLEFYQYCLDLEFGQDQVDYHKWVSGLRSLIGTFKEQFILTANAAELAAQRSVLKNVDLEHAEMFASLKAQTKSAGIAARTVLALKPDVVSFADNSPSLSVVLSRESSRAKILSNFSPIVSRLVVLLRKVHESGLVHGNITADAFVWVGGEENDYTKNFWRIAQLDSASSFIANENHIPETRVELTDSPQIDSLTVYQLDAFPFAPPLARRDDAFCLMEMVMDILFPRPIGDKESPATVLAYKRNRHWNPQDHHGIVSRMYYRSMHYGFTEPPNYESALGELMRRIR